MSGNTIGGKKTAATLLAKNPNHYRDLGKLGGSKLGVKKGFALLTHAELIAASRKGGKQSRKPKV